MMNGHNEVADFPSQPFQVPSRKMHSTLLLIPRFAGLAAVQQKVTPVSWVTFRVRGHLKVTLDYTLIVYFLFASSRQYSTDISV